MSALHLSNNPPTDAEIYAEKVAKYEADAKAFETITEENEKLANDHKQYGVKLKKEIEGVHETEKKPHLEAGRKVDAAYKPLIMRAEDHYKALDARIQKYLRAKAAKAEQAAREAAEAARKIEEEARAKAAAEAAAAAPADDIFAEFMAATAPAPEAVLEAKAAAAEAAKAVEAASRVGSASGYAKTTGIRAIPKVARITDLAACAAFYAGRKHLELEAVLQKIANAEVRAAKGAAVTIPGVDVVEAD